MVSMRRNCLVGSLVELYCCESFLLTLCLLVSGKILKKKIFVALIKIQEHHLIKELYHMYMYTTPPSRFNHFGQLCPIIVWYTFYLLVCLQCLLIGPKISSCKNVFTLNRYPNHYLLQKISNWL